MPSLILFKRRWLAGSDDLVLPGILLALTHFIFFITATVFASSYQLDIWSAYDPDEISQLNANQTSIQLAKCANKIRVYSFIFVTLLILAFLLEIVLTAFSMQGTVVDSAPRKPVEYILYGRSLLGVVELIFSIAACVHLSQLWGLCSTFQHILALEVGIIIVNFSCLIIVLMVIICTYDSSGHTFYQLKMAKSGDVSVEHLSKIVNKFDEHSQNTWNRRLRRCCCCVGDTSNTNIALDEVSYLLRDFFKDLDVVPSDILAGMVLLRHKQQCIESKKIAASNDIDEYFCGRPIRENSKFVDPCSPEESTNFDNLLYYCYYAIAAYGSLFYMVYNPGTGLCKVLDQCLCNGRYCGARDTSMVFVEEDKCCNVETAAVTRSLMENIDNSVLIYSSWKNNLYEQPFFVCVDFDKQAVVVTVRGTLSEMDALTDLVATPELIPVEGNDGSLKAHKGIMKGAIYVKNRLIHDAILEGAFSYDPARETDQFQLVVLGHSLGAGIAAILAIMMRPLYPQLKCYCYAPPGGLLSLSAMETSKSYIHTTVYGKDIVARAGIRQLLKLRVDMINLLRRSDVPKYKIIFGNTCKRTQERHSLFALGDRVGNEEESLTHPQFLGGCENLYPPGRILHIVYQSQTSGPCCFIGSPDPKSYFAIEANNKEDFDEILISHNMVTHHLPQELLKALKKVRNTSLPGNDTMKYSRSLTMPSSAPMTSNQNEADKMLDPSGVEVIVESRSETSHNSGVIPPTIEVNDQTETKGNQNDQFPNQSFRENSNSNNNKESPSPSQSKAETDEMTSSRTDENRSASLVGRSEDNADVRLVALNDDVTATSSKYTRSHSVPHPTSGVAIDKNTLKRARLEPNLIPKPPRSNSMRQPSTDQIINQRHSTSFSLHTPGFVERNQSRNQMSRDEAKSASLDCLVATSSIHFIDDDPASNDVDSDVIDVSQ